MFCLISTNQINDDFIKNKTVSLVLNELHIM